MNAVGKYCIIGAPDHLGVFHVGGRLGADLGPRAFREAFGRMKGRLDLKALCHWDRDIGPLSGNIHEHHNLAIEAMRAARSEGAVPILIGGGHDFGYAQLKSHSAKSLGCINLDAHFDLRSTSPKFTSGSPFFAAIETGVIDPKRLVEFGIQVHANTPELWAYADKKGVLTVPYWELRGKNAAEAFEKQLTKLAKSCDEIALSVDLDAASEAHAPGVSAPQSEGFNASEMIEIAEIAGSHPKVMSLGLYELCPAHDVQGKTARLAATIAYHFIERRNAVKSPRRKS